MKWYAEGIDWEIEAEEIIDIILSRHPVEQMTILNLENEKDYLHWKNSDYEDKLFYTEWLIFQKVIDPSSILCLPSEIEIPEKTALYSDEINNYIIARTGHFPKSYRIKTR